MQKTGNRVRLAESLKELAEAGCPVDTSVADMEDQQVDVEINQVGESLMLQQPYGGTSYILDLEFINQTSKTIYCSEIELRMRREDTFFEWLPDPKENPRKLSYFRRNRKGERELVEAESDSYCFFGGSQLEYPHEEVLNHILLKRRILAPGRPLRGLLLARGGAMPNEARHGQWVEPTLSFISSKHVEYTATILMRIDRMEAKPKPARKSSLYDDPAGDFGPTDAGCIQPAIVCDLESENATS